MATIRCISVIHRQPINIKSVMIENSFRYGVSLFEHEHEYEHDTMTCAKLLALGYDEGPGRCLREPSKPTKFPVVPIFLKTQFQTVLSLNDRQQNLYMKL